MGQVLAKRNNKEVLKLESKEEHFIHNGGVLLEKRLALQRGKDIGAGQLKIFSTKDIQKATSYYESDLIVGSSTSGTIYKGFLDDRIVIIKAPPVLKPNTELIDLILTEASTGMVMNHDNMVKLYGCCLDTYIPIPVYEFVPSGSLFNNLHDRSLKWADRLRILTDISYALSYMHNALSKPVVHRDVKSDCILLDGSFHAKLSHFGYSVSITPGESSQKKWPVQGTPGYIDPEYVETQEVTDKCDVYSFGVLMLELLTRQKPIMMAKAGIDLVDAFVSAVVKNCMMEMVDSKVLGEASADEIEEFAQLALTCVSKKGVERPIMVEVVRKLWQIQGQHSK